MNFFRVVRRTLEKASRRQHPDPFDEPIHKDKCPDCATVFFVVRSEIRFCPHCGRRGICVKNK